MTLQTFEEQEILARVRRLEHLVLQLTHLCREILKDVEPVKYKPMKAITVTPIHHGHHHHHHRS